MELSEESFKRQTPRTFLEQEKGEKLMGKLTKFWNNVITLKITPKP